MIKAAISEYMEQNFLFKFDDEITESTDLFKAGIMDSFGYVQLMQFLQENFDIKFSKQELLSDVISSLSGIVEAVEAKLEAGKAA
ncbi:phosphopantetheine-binding protein [Pendulispora brunnea]|uniref:Phosphopantetheine-binding protein n=1 Tax=Pendulispora brunnea TaxID=2905690 RepID=A0ABZ2KNE7_9BACT